MLTLINDKPGKIILSKRGLRQRDPLSPLLFVLVADTFTRMLNLVASKGLLIGIGRESFSQKVLTLQHADDTLLFSKANQEYSTTLKLILYGFELACRLKINFSWSYVYLLEEQIQIATMLNCKVGRFFITYLGIPLRPHRLLPQIGNLS